MMEYTLFGESHGPAVGILVRNVPAGLAVDWEAIKEELLRRRGDGNLTTSRRENDTVEFLAGVFQGKTTGDPLVAILRNQDTRSEDYDSLRTVARPGHGDYTAYIRSGGHNDYRGGGHLSARLTAPLVAVGTLAKAYLKRRGITVTAVVCQEEELRRRAEEARQNGDSVGGQILCTISGVKPGLGGRDYPDAIESQISRLLFSLPAVKAIGFGSGEDFARMTGSQANDALRTDGKRIYTATNHAGGINGGITNGMDITFTVTFRPTPSIAREQDTVDFVKMENTTLSVTGRHDACVVLRSAPIVEAAAAFALCQWIEPEEDDLESLRLALDTIDAQLVPLFVQRQEIARMIGDFKKSRGLPVRDSRREASVLESRAAMAPEYAQSIKELYEQILHLSREVQQ